MTIPPESQETPPTRHLSATRAAIEHLRTAASLLRSAGWEQSADAVEALADDLVREM
jgi:aminopeptidase C